MRFYHNRWLLILPAIVVTVTVFWLWQTQQPQDVKASLLSEPSDCQLHQQACQIIDQQILVKLDITPKPIPIAKGLSVQVDITGIQPKRVQLDINGSNMYMGYNRIDLQIDEQGRWVGKTLLAFCTIDQMAWQLTVMIDTASGEQIQAPFPLVTPFNAR
jgi:hypothetical protein